MTDKSSGFGRRTALKALGAAALGTVGFAGTDLSSGSVAAANGGAPTVEWQHSYEGGETEYTGLSLRDVLQTEDGGYALMGRGQPVTQTGPEQEQFAVVKTDSEGEKQWISFANDEDEETELRLVGFLQTEDSGHVAVGNLDWVNPDAHLIDGGPFGTEGLPSGAAAKFGPDGEVEWVTTIDAGTDQPREDGDLKAVVKSSTDDGFVAAGEWHDDEENTFSPWLVKFGSDGSVQWERTYDDLGNLDRFQYAFARDGGGYTLIETISSYLEYYPFRVADVDENGDVEDSREVDLGDLGISTDHETRDIILTSDGGFALAGRLVGQENWNMWLAKLDETLEKQWLQTYDGPYEGSDSATELIRTDDGGYALGGYMREAYTGIRRPAIVKTDAEGNEQWEKLIEAHGHEVDGFTQTDDGGYAAVMDKALAKLGPGGDGNGDGGDGDGDGGAGDGDGDGGDGDDNGDGDDTGDAEQTASVTFGDQDSDGSSVVVQSATLSDGGYLVIHASEDGAPGAVLGHSKYLDPGTHSNVEITLDSSISSDQTLIAMAHTDDGDQEYEFPDADGPYTADEQPVTDDATITVC